MKRKAKVTMILSMVLGISSICAVILASSSERFIFVKRLQVEEFKQVGDDSYSADVLDNGVRVAYIYIRVEHPKPLDIPVLVAIWHAEETEVDSLFLKIYGETSSIQVYLKVPGYWPPIHFHYIHTDHGQGTIIEVRDLGYQGTGTVDLNFLLRAFSEQHGFNFEVKFSMHKKAFMQLTRQEAWAYTKIPIPT